METECPIPFAERGGEEIKFFLGLMAMGLDPTGQSKGKTYVGPRPNLHYGFNLCPLTCIFSS
jgi:hypothetical protein